MNRKERVLTALNHKEPDRVPIDFGSFSGATSMNVRAYQNLLDYFGIQREPRVENTFIFTAVIDDDILDRFHVDTKSVKPSFSLDEFNAPEEFVDVPWNVRWRRSEDFTYAPMEGPFQKLVHPSIEDLKTFRWPSPLELEDPTKWKEKAQRARQETDRALVGRLPMGIVSLAQILRGFEGWAMDLILNKRFSDALNPLQANARDMEPEKIKERVGKDLALWGGIDTHLVLPRGDSGGGQGRGQEED